MSLRLKSLQFLPRDGGWSSPVYRFAPVTTLVTGDNGAGKTPMLRTLAVALGAKLELPQIIVKKCRSVRLVLADQKRTVAVERHLGEVSATFHEGGAETECSGEEEISREIMRQLSIEPRNLVRRSDNQPVPPYMSVLAPLFVVDQDHGWKDVYEPPPNVNFLHDQREEALRWILDIPQRSVANTKQEKDEAKRRETVLVEAIDVKKRLIESLRRQVGDDGHDGGREGLEAQRAAVTERLSSLIQSYDGLAKIDAVIEAETRQSTTDRDEARERLQSLERQASNLRQTKAELTNETSVLEANEIAADVFRKFCGNEDCNLFRPQDSYGRRLLYMRDQLKDIDSTSSLLAQQIQDAIVTLAQRQARLDQYRQRQRADATRSGGETLVSAIEALTREIADVSIRLDKLTTLEGERKRLGALIGQAQRATEVVEQLAGTRSSPGGTRLTDARTLFATATDKWLTALNTRHVSATHFDASLVPFIGDERFSISSSQSGSTRTRVVLALHAALIETSILMHGYHPPFLILDAPKQQELHRSDLAAFVSACEALFGDQEPPFQLIVGAKEQDIFQHTPTEIWEPTFKSDEGLHFLG